MRVTMHSGDPRALQKAKHNVENHYVVVGLLEYMNVTAAVFEHKLPGTLCPLIFDQHQKHSFNSREKHKVFLQTSHNVCVTILYKYLGGGR